VIPTVLLPSLLIGRWWAVPLAAAVWTALLLATGTIGAEGIPGAAGFAVANAIVGVGVHQAVRSLVRGRRSVV
jgi:hypothetical protein